MWKALAEAVVETIAGLSMRHVPMIGAWCLILAGLVFRSVAAVILGGAVLLFAMRGTPANDS